VCDLRVAEHGARKRRGWVVESIEAFWIIRFLSGNVRTRVFIALACGLPNL
jgi:hypothetical protein